jgi:hypothetical protein
MMEFALSCCLLAVAAAAAAAAPDVPSRDGLRLWLDASDAASIAAGPDGPVKAWADKSPDGHPVRVEGEPKLIPDAMNGLPVIRLDGHAAFTVGDVRSEPGPVTVFVVSRRPQELASDDRWQRIFSSWDGSETPDHQGQNFAVLAGDGGSGDAYGPSVSYTPISGAVIRNLTVGRTAMGNWQGFRGDLAEVLVYDRGFLSEDAIQIVLQYLSEKWGAQVARKDLGWTRTGPLGETPERVSDSLPLSDQANAGNWQRFEPMSDEFDGDSLDETKWVPWHHYWQGRQPAFFWTENSKVHDGMLNLTMRKEEAPDQPRDRGYEGYTSACVSSKAMVRYGYIEIRARPMRSAGSSAFWLQTNKGEATTEIDVFEIGGAAPGFERKDNMNLHVFDRRPDGQGHWSRGGVWVAPWDLADDFHVYGLEWDAESIKCYVDGVVVRTTPNTDWHQELYLFFDSETMPNWFGMPRDEDLPSTFSIDYVRAWQKG